MSILFVGDKSEWSKKANDFIKEHFYRVQSVLWQEGERYPEEINVWKGDIILSFKSDLVLSRDVLEKAGVYALNFHPAPPEYRGIGGYNYAIDRNDELYGATCHHMVEEIDFGTIVKVSRFPIIRSEKASSLKVRTGVYCLVMLYEIVDLILKGSALPISDELWGNKLYTKKELEKFLHEVGKTNNSVS